jgi:hypothetical protein
VLLMWIKVKDIAGPLLVGIFEKSKDLVHLAIDCVQQRSKSTAQLKQELDSKVAVTTTAFVRVFYSYVKAV